MSDTDPSLCPGCNGTGQVSFFGGVSRFQFSYDECPECSGTGFISPPKKDTILTGEQIAATCGLSPRNADKFLTSLSRILLRSLEKGEQIQLRGFGSFVPVYSKTKKRALHFKPAKNLLP